MSRTDVDSRAPSETLAATLAPKPKREKSPHPGVQLLEPKGLNVSWRLLWRDPETGKRKVKNLSAAEARDKDTRKSAAMRKWKELQKRKHEIDAGAAPHREADTPLKAALERYFTDYGHLKSAKTIRGYRAATDSLLAWAQLAGVRTVRQLTKARLREWAISRTKVEKRVPLKGGTKGETTEGGKRSPHSVNKEMRAMGTVLNKLRKADVIRLSREEISDALEKLEAPVERQDFLRPAQIKKLLDACKKHDAETYVETREEHGGKRKRGTTPRFTPITEFVKFVLFSGARPEEAIKLLASDADESKIHVRAAVAKTKKPRDIDFAVSTTLQTMQLHERHGLLFRFTMDELDSARERLMKRGAPHFTWRTLRRTAGTYLTCAPGIFGAASAYLSARQLGHSVTIAERHYVGVIKISPNAKTLEAAYGLAAD